MAMDIAVPLLIIPLLMLGGEDTLRITAHALHASRIRPFKLTLGLFAMTHLTSLDRHYIAVSNAGFPLNRSPRG